MEIYLVISMFPSAVGVGASIFGSHAAKSKIPENRTAEFLIKLFIKYRMSGLEFIT
jgi:hypothetical protein